VNPPDIIQGRHIGASQLEEVRQLLVQHPHWSRRQLSQHLATLWDWRNGVGRLKDMAARTLLLKLQARGWIALPARRQAPSNRMRHKRVLAIELPAGAPLTQPLAALLPLGILEVSTPSGAAHRALFAGLLHQHHYLSYRSPVGENLQYLVRDSQARPVACVLFGAAAWQCAARDRYIGWDGPTRAQKLHRVTNNTRFLILPWVQVTHLASHVLSRITQRVSRDWQDKYGHPIELLETFVQRDRFAGTCYRAANWVRVGQTKGRSRQDRADRTHHQVPLKDVYLYPLHPRFRQRLQGTIPTQSPPPSL
jgi:hypothetical protein